MKKKNIIKFCEDSLSFMKNDVKSYSNRIRCPVSCVEECVNVYLYLQSCVPLFLKYKF